MRGVMMFAKFNAVAALVLISLLVSVPARAQVSGATLSGTVTDPSGSGVPNATVSIKNTATGISREVTTDTAGFYSTPNLPPGGYEVTFSAPGFTTQVQKGITLTVGAQQTLNSALKVGQVSQRIEVTGEVAQVELTSSAITDEVNSTTVRELPLNGRDWSSLAVLQPGVIGIRTQLGTTGTVNRGNRGFGNQLSVVGHRPTENNYRVNGITINDYTNGSPGSVGGAQLGVDAIQEFSVVTANYTAEYGRTSGGVINAVTKPGTNNFHGTAYWFLRDEGLDARNFFDKTIAPFHRNQFGASAGGPIQKGKTFIFGDYEGIRQTKGLTGNSAVPSPALRGIGTGPGGAAGPSTLCSIPQGPPTPCVTTVLSGAVTPDPTTGIDTAVLPYLAFFPLPNNGLIGNGDTGSFVTSLRQVYTENYVTTRVDHHFSDKDDLDASWFYDKSPQTTPDNLLIATHQTTSERWMGGLEWTHSFSPSLVNIARVGYNRSEGHVGQPAAALKPIGSDTSFGTGVVPNRPAPILTGLGAIDTMQGTLGNQSTFHHVQNSYQIYDDAFLTHGAHALKLGIAVERVQNNTLAVTRPDGTFNFGGLVPFLTNRPLNGFLIGDPSVQAELSTRFTILAGYVQDNWRFRPNLTFNLGMRYEMETNPTQAHIPFSVIQTLTTAPVNVSHPWQTNPTHRNFEPRIGFAWDPFRNGKTSVRGGFGIFDVLPGSWVINQEESQAFPFSLSKTANNLPAGSFPHLIGVPLGASSHLAYAPDQKPKRNYAMNWNLTIQRQLGQTLTATIGYVGSHTVHSPFTTDTSNSVGPPQVIQTAAGTLWPCGPDGTGNPCAVGFLPTGTTAAPIPSTVFNSNVGQIRPTFFSVSSHYSGLQAQLLKSFSHGLQAEASYTWGKCIDSGSNGNIGDPYRNSPSSLIFFAPGSRNGLCDFNVGQNFVGNWIWQVPTPKFSSAILEHVAGGWEVGGILTASTGTPFTLAMDGDPIFINNGDSLTYPSRLAGCDPVNSNWKATLQYVNVACFTPPIAPASMAAQCATNSYPNAAAPPPSGMIYCQNLFGNAGRNHLIGPKIVNFDFSVFKNNYIPRISESFNVQFRAEMFNILNHANFQSPGLTGPTQTIFTSTGAPSGGRSGRVDGTSTEARQIQFGLKVIW